jgi:hypothetical protein
MREWKPIKTAPKDGTLIFIREKDSRVQVASWGTSSYGYDLDWYVQLTNKNSKGTRQSYPTIDVTHWMPIPDLKEESE